MFQHGEDLVNRDTREPLEKLRYECAVLEIFEQGGNRNTRARKYPCATYALGIAFYDRTRGPIDHRSMLPPRCQDGQTPYHRSAHQGKEALQAGFRAEVKLTYPHRGSVPDCG